MAKKLDPTKIQVFGGPVQVISGPPLNQESMSPEQVLGPWDPFGGERAPMEAEGRLNGVLGRSPQEFMPMSCHGAGPGLPIYM